MHHLRLAGSVLLKLLLAFAALIGAVQVFRLLMLPGLQSLFHLGDPATSLLRRIGIVLFAVSAYWAYVRFFEKRKASELRPAPLAIAVGAVSGSLQMAVSIALLSAIGVYGFAIHHGTQGGLPGVAGLILIAAFLEELAYRCILFRILENAWGTVPALCLNSLIFAFGHTGNLEGRVGMQEMVTMLVSVTLTGALWTLVFVHSRNLWVASANHAAWNFTIVLSGLPLSGIEDWRRMAPLVGEYHGPTWLSGGVFGPETSIVTMTLTAAVVAALLYRARTRKLLLGGAARRVDAPALPQPEAGHA